jgi:transcriptional regulator with XRE-family HTH domain
MLNMTPTEFLAFRRRLGWSLKTLAGQLGMHPSRLADFESGHSRGKVKKPVVIPKVVELACKWLEDEERRRRPPESDEEWVALLRDTSHLPVVEEHPPLDLSRDGIYGVPGDRET